MAELAAVLHVDKELVKIAVSAYCRLGFARKKTLDVTPPKRCEWHPSWLDGAGNIAAAATAAGAGGPRPSVSGEVPLGPSLSLASEAPGTLVFLILFPLIFLL